MQCNAQIQLLCNAISQTLLWHIENKKIYDLDALEAAQIHHQAAVKRKLVSIFESILQTLTATFEIFKADGPSVYANWVKYIEGIDFKIEQSLRTTVKKSLSEISKAINGEGKRDGGGSEIHPLFKVNVILEAQKVEFSPSFSKLQESMSKISKDMIASIAAIPRLAQKLTPDFNSNNSRFFDIISTEEDILKIIVNIQSGMSQNATKCQVYLRNWDSYREIWEINKDAFIRRYAKLKPALTTFDADINRYSEVANNAQKEETLTNINFVRLDCSLLKHALVSHCSAWQSKLTTLLNQNAVTELKGLLEMFSKTTLQLQTPPKDLDQLSECLVLLTQLQADVPKIESQFAPINEMYAILETYEVPVKDEEKSKLQLLPKSWSDFQQALISADLLLQESKGKFKNDLIASAEDYTKSVATIKDEFQNKGPFTANLGVDKAMKSIGDFRRMLANAQNQEKTMKKGLSVFKIDHTPSKDMEMVASDLELLNQVWTAFQEWSTSYNVWRGKHFLQLDAFEIDDVVQKFIKRLTKLGKEVKDWDVFSNLKERVNQTKRTVPLLQDLRNPAMRERHWNAIMDEIGKSFSTISQDFTLDKIYELGLDQHTETIAALSVAASKELSIEQGIQAIADAWEQLDIEISPYKEEKGYWKIKTAEPVFELLEDNQVTLSTMKASKFFKAFESLVDAWERNLSLIVEVIETLLLVQKQWMYLENIFVGTEDIRKQLPKESGVFDKINTSFKAIMHGIQRHRNALSVAQTPNILDELVEMNLQLEKIQKSLDMYLETKRQSFPRFYFLSNDDLLEILGQAKDPNSIQPHLKKCFDNLHKLELVMAGVDGRRHNEAIGMHSGDGEYVPFAAPVIVEGMLFF